MKYAIVVLAMLASCKAAEKPSVPGPTLVDAADVVQAHRGQLATGPHLSGALEARTKAVIRAEASGTIVQLRVDVGDSVRKGQLLARIDDTSVRDGARAAETQAKSAELEQQTLEKQAERIASLVQAGALAVRDLEAARAQVALAQARLEAARAGVTQARERLGWTVISAPIDGVVSARTVNQGDVAQVGAELVTIIDPSSMRLRATVPSESLEHVEVGAAVTFHVRGLGAQAFSGVVERVAPEVDAVTRQIPVWVTLPNPNGKLVAGLFADGRITGTMRDALLITAGAVNLASTPIMVKRVSRDEVVEDVVVTVGGRDSAENVIELTSAIAEGDIILRGGAAALPAGTKVRLTEQPTQPTAQATVPAAVPATEQPLSAKAD